MFKKKKKKKDTRVGCHFLCQGIIPSQEPNLRLLCLLHWQMDSVVRSHLSLKPIPAPTSAPSQNRIGVRSHQDESLSPPCGSLGYNHFWAGYSLPLGRN